MNGRIIFFGLLTTLAASMFLLVVFFWRSIAGGDGTDAKTFQPNFQDTREYDRKLFGEWTDLDEDCLDTRAETLKDRSLIPITIGESGCQILIGMWIDDYSGEELYSPSDIEIDHIFPLRLAWEFGAKDWSAAMKRTFSNDESNLAITAISINRSKGASGPVNWLPKSEERRCQYVTSFLQIASKYQINLPREEIDEIEGLVKDFCG
jgi:hypothetical protein